MKQSSPLLGMNTYRARLPEVQAVDLDDGRFLLATEPPRYVPMAEFLDAFELVPERRTAERRTKVVKRPKGAERRAAPRRASSNGNGTNPVKDEAQRLFESGAMDVNALRKKFKLSYSTVYSWSKKWKAPKRTKVASEDLASAIAARTSGDGQPPRLPRTRAEVDQVLDQVRVEVDQKMVQRQEAKKTGRPLQAGESVGTGRKVCVKCNMLNSSSAAECGSCGTKFVKAGR